jgi:hypothetical protein
LRSRQPAQRRLGDFPRDGVEAISNQPRSVSTRGPARQLALRMTTLRWRVESSAKRDTAVLTASLRINITKGSGWAESTTSVQHRSVRPCGPLGCAEGRARGYEQSGTARVEATAAFLQRHESPDERVLHDVLAVDDRPHETGAVSVQIVPQLAGEGEKLRPAIPVQRGPSCAHSAAASSIVTPVSPLSPKAKPSAYFGSSSTETTFSPNSRSGIGAPKRGPYCHIDCVVIIKSEKPANVRGWAAIGRFCSAAPRSLFSLLPESAVDLRTAAHCNSGFA